MDGLAEKHWAEPKRNADRYAACALAAMACDRQASPSSHFVTFAQSILYRGAGLDVLQPQFLAVALVRGLFQLCNSVSDRLQRQSTKFQ